MLAIASYSPLLGANQITKYICFVLCILCMRNSIHILATPCTVRDALQMIKDGVPNQ